MKPQPISTDMEAEFAMDATQQRIVDAAEQRFQHYGYRKTNVTEIAADCDMSAANLYRYFANKEDIAAACALRCMAQRDEHLQQVLARADLTASQRLAEFAIALLRYTHDLASNHAHLNELVETVVGQRPEVVHHKIQQTRAMLQQIIEQGQAEGEFASGDAAQLAETVHTSLTLFSTPMFIVLFSLAELERKASALVDLLLNGLTNKTN